MIDITLLRIVKHRKDYMKLIHAVPFDALDTKMQVLLHDFKKYFTMFPEHESIDFTVFLPRFHLWHKDFDESTMAVYSAVLRNVIPDVDDSTKSSILEELYQLDLATNIANLAAEFDAGNLNTPFYTAVSSLIDKYKSAVDYKKIDYINDDISDILMDEINDVGVSWRLGCLNESMRKARPGDWGIIAARPDKGKTTFLSSELTHMASQLPEDKNIIWLNNEGLGRRIIPRLYQSALGLTMPELVQLNTEGKLKQQYADVVGRPDKIRIFDIHDKDTAYIENIFDGNNPGIVVFDMLDHVRGFGTESRTDQRLEELYKWGRERTVKYEMIGLATSQVSADGEGQPYPTQDMLKDSKTGKQGACDFILMIGAINQENMQNSRFISLPKNKLRKVGAKGDPHCEVKFKPLIGRFEDIGIGDYVSASNEDVEKLLNGN